jgi:FixJ family two-component response regulator
MLSGLDFQTELTEASIHIPSISMTRHGDISMSVRAMKARAVEFLSKPFREPDLLGAGSNRTRTRSCQTRLREDASQPARSVKSLPHVSKR